LADTIGVVVVKCAVLGAAALPASAAEAHDRSARAAKVEISASSTTHRDGTTARTDR
jgi:uncharacterized lipoprotein NlpE involved in copper resistance